MKFFFVNVLERDWPVFRYLNARRERRLPCILSREEVFQVLAQVSTFHNCAFLTTVYACGLRLSEALALLERYLDRKVQYYPPEEVVPIDGVVPDAWRDAIVEPDPPELDEDPSAPIDPRWAALDELVFDPDTE